ncbi:hypothetical protein D3C83_141060 [compost metagenome]
MCAKALVASSRLSENREVRCDRRSLISLKRAFLSAGSSAPPSRKSRSSFSTIFFCARVRRSKSGPCLSALNLA